VRICRKIKLLTIIISSLTIIKDSFLLNKNIQLQEVSKRL